MPALLVRDAQVLMMCQVPSALPSLQRLTRLAYDRGFSKGPPGWERKLLASTAALTNLQSLHLATALDRYEYRGACCSGRHCSISTAFAHMPPPAVRRATLSVAQTEAITYQSIFICIDSSACLWQRQTYMRRTLGHRSCLLSQRTRCQCPWTLSRHYRPSRNCASKPASSWAQTSKQCCAARCAWAKDSGQGLGEGRNWGRGSGYGTPGAALLMAIIALTALST